VPEVGGQLAYALVHLVAREAMSSVVPSQVVDHAEWHASNAGPDAPADVAVGLLEPIRVALTGRLRLRGRAHGSRATRAHHDASVFEPRPAAQRRPACEEAGALRTRTSAGNALPRGGGHDLGWAARFAHSANAYSRRDCRRHPRRVAGGVPVDARI
jgi:hypothetical protein